VSAVAVYLDRLSVRMLTSTDGSLYARHAYIVLAWICILRRRRRRRRRRPPANTSEKFSEKALFGEFDVDEDAPVADDSDGERRQHSDDDEEDGELETTFHLVGLLYSCTYKYLGKALFGLIRH